MGLLIPEDIPLDKLPASERRVIRTFQSTLKDSWLIIPEINLIEKDRTHEIDVLLINELQGIAAIEVKGGTGEARSSVLHHLARPTTLPLPSGTSFVGIRHCLAASTYRALWPYPTCAISRISPIGYHRGSSQRSSSSPATSLMRRAVWRIASGN